MELTIYDPQVRGILDSNAELQKLADGFRFTEGPVRRGDAIYFTDFYLDRIYRYENGKVTLITEDSHRTVGMTLTHDGRLLGCTSGLHAICDVESGEILADSFSDGYRFNGTNDLIEASDGKLYFSDPYVHKYEGSEFARSVVFCLDHGELSSVCFDLPWPNGVALSPDERTLYIIDSREMRLYAVNRATGERSLLTQFSKEMGAGLPDGMCVREDGTIFVAGPGGISVISPDGKLLGLLRMPEVAANLCLDEKGLFITASTSIYHIDLL